MQHPMQRAPSRRSLIIVIVRQTAGEGKRPASFSASKVTWSR